MARNAMFGPIARYSKGRHLPYSTDIIARLDDKYDLIMQASYDKATKIINKNTDLINQLIVDLAIKKDINQDECDELVKKNGGIQL